MDDVFECLMIGIPQTTLLAKYLTVNLQISKLDAVNELINSPMFGAKSKEDEQILLEHNTFMNRMYNFINVCIAIAGIFWPLSYIFRRYHDANIVVTIYMPFDTDTWLPFTISAVFQSVIYLWVGYGHIALDLIVAAYFSQAALQLKIIKYNLEHMFDTAIRQPSGSFQYSDIIDAEVKKKFVYYVQRFGKVSWYADKVNEIFNPAMLYQFFTSSITLCFLVYRLTFTPVGTVPFVFIIILLCLVSTQVLLYCYFGTMVNTESDLLVRSLYLSDWLLVSPKFRSLLLIAMACWAQPITPLVAGLIPLSLDTFVSILKFAYSLYTLMGSTN